MFILVLHVPQTVYFGFQPQIPHNSFFCFMSVSSWFAAQYRTSYFIFCSFKLKRKNSCPYFTLWVCLLKFKLSIQWERKCDLSGFAFNVAWLLVPERLVWIFQHLWMHNTKPWSRWATAAEDHTRCHCFKLRTANWGYKWHRLTKTRQQEIGKCCMFLWILMKTTGTSSSGTNKHRCTRCTHSYDYTLYANSTKGLPVSNIKP